MKPFFRNHIISLFPVSVEVPGERRVQRWAVSIDELVSDPTGLQEFTSFLRKEYSHENIRFWLAVMDLRRSSTKQIPKKLEDIYEYVYICKIVVFSYIVNNLEHGLKRKLLSYSLTSLKLLSQSLCSTH